MSRRRVLVVTGDPLGAKLSGPGIRAWNMAEALSQVADVRIISFTSADRLGEGFDVSFIARFDNRAMREHEQWADIIVTQGNGLGAFKVLRRSRKILVVDIYDPMHLEQLEQAKHLDRDAWARNIDAAARSLDFQLRRGDFFLCASERQRLFWLGQLAGLGRLNPETYTSDPSMRNLIAVVPFGLSRTAPRSTRPVMRDIVPGIGQKDKILLWSGGLYNWFDPLGLIRAVAKLATKHSDVRLFFMGTKHPNPHVPEMEILTRSRELARDLDVEGTSVFFNDTWVEFDDRANYLLEADVGVSTHFDHIETEFSFRTRILDYLWAKLPMVVTRGDYFGDLVETEELGLSVAADDVDALASALESVLYKRGEAGRFARNVARVRKEFFWDLTLAPLVDFVVFGSHAADLRDVPRRGFTLPWTVRYVHKLAAAKHVARRTLETARDGGLVAKVLQRFGRGSAGGD